MSNKREDSRLVRFFTYIFVPLVLLWVLFTFLSTMYSGARAGDMPGAFGVTTSQFLYICLLLILILVSSAICRRLPENHLLSSQEWGEYEAKRFGAIGGIAFGFSVFTIQSIENFYLRWGIMFLFLEIAALGGKAYLNLKRRKRLTS